MFPFHAVSKDVNSIHGNAKSMDKFFQARKTENCKLSLAYQNLTEVPAKILKKYSSTLVELDLSHNQIQEFKFLMDLPQLEVLILDHNGLQSQVKFPVCLSLHTLWINHNSVENLGLFTATISTSFPNLKYLSMMNNEAAPSYFNGGSYVQYQDYRHFVISQMKKLIQLDDTLVTKEERQEAERIYAKYKLH